MSLNEDIAAIARQEADLHFDGFTEADAFRLGNLVHAEATRRALALVVNIRSAARTLFHAATPGSAPDNDDWIRRKSNTALRVNRSSYGYGLGLRERGESIDPGRGMEPLDYAAHGGAFPIRVRGTGVVAALTVSGLPQREDHRLAVWAVCTFLGIDPAAYDLPSA